MVAISNNNFVTVVGREDGIRCSAMSAGWGWGVKVVNLFAPMIYHVM
jgi:hypothetical protein